MSFPALAIGAFFSRTLTIISSSGESNSPSLTLSLIVKLVSVLTAGVSKDGFDDVGLIKLISHGAVQL
jgi:hypothetical protein